MKKEDKDLLLKDLCARLPYGVKLLYNSNSIANIKDRVEILRGITIGYTIWFETNYDHYEYESTSGSYEHFKPYLRPMSSMTEEEKKDLLNYVVGKDGAINFEVCNDGYIRGIGMAWVNFQPNTTSRYIDWLLKNHFDICDLIPKGLALEAPEGMYNF